MNFKEWLISEETLFNEDFKTQREKFIQQGIEPNIVDSYLTNFRTIKDKKYKQINDPIHGLENIKDRTNIDNYKTFHELEILVDYVKGQVDVVGKTNYKNIKVDAKPIYEDNNIIIYYADSPQACITYKGSVPYSWCVARTDVNNMFYTYRFKEHRPAFYFVKNKERTNNEFKFLNSLKHSITLKFIDPYHFFVIQVVKNANPQDKERKQYIVTSAQNNGDVQMSWNDIIKIEPALANLQDKFVSNPLSEKEEELYQRFKKGISDEEFAKLPYDEKDMYLNIYVRMDKTLTDNQFKNLPFDLKNKYIGFGVGLSDEQMKMIDSKLYKRYEEVTKTKIEKTIGTDDFKLQPSEIEIFIKFEHEFDFKKLSASNVYFLLLLATDKEQIAKLLQQHTDNISKLYDQHVASLIKNVTNKDKFAEIIINNKKELSSDNVYCLISDATDKDKIAELIIQKKPILYGHEVYTLFKFATDKDQMAQLLKLDENAKRTILNISLSHGNLDIVKYLVEKGIDLSKPYDNPVSHAAKSGNVDIVKYLVEKGVKINDFAVSGAAEKGHLDIIKYLLGDEVKDNEGNIIKLPDDIKPAKIGDNALANAAQNGAFDVVKYLVDEKNVKIKSSDTRNVFQDYIRHYMWKKQDQQEEQ